MDTKIYDTTPDTAIMSLTGMDADINSFFILDRYLGDDLQLPYSFEEIKVKTNELCVSSNLNACFFKLHYNFLYLNAQTKIASNNFPQRYRGYITSTQSSGSANVGWYSVNNALSSNTNAVTGQLADTNGTVLSGLVDGVFTQAQGSPGRYTGFIANYNTLLAVHSNTDDNMTELRLNKKTIEDATALSFTNITSLAINSQNHLLVADGTNIHKFDVNAVITDNPAISGIGRFLIRTIGGTSKNIYDKDKFKTPVSLAIGRNDKVYVLDHDDRGFKVYDKDLNWLHTASRKTDFASISGGLVRDICVDTDNDHTYVLASNGAVLKYSDEFTLLDKFIFSDPLDIGEEYKRMVFSRKDSNVVYVLTNKSIFKKLKTKMTRSAGAFRLLDNNIEDQTLSFVDVLQTDDITYDYVFAGGESTHTGIKSQVGKIFKFEEKLNYQTISYDIYKTDTYTLSAINVAGDEYVTAWVVNKSLHKLIYNHLLFRDSIHYKYDAEYDNVGRIQYNNIRYLADDDTNLFGFSTTMDNFIGLNEPVLASTINRPLKEIYDMQLKLLEMCRENILNQYPFASTVVGLK